MLLIKTDGTDQPRTGGGGGSVAAVVVPGPQPVTSNTDQLYQSKAWWEY